MSQLLLFFLVLIAGGGVAIHHFGSKAGKGPVFEVQESNGWATLIATPAPLPFRITVVSMGLAIFPAWIAGAFVYSLSHGSFATPIVGYLVWVGAGILIRKMWQGYHDQRRKVVREQLEVSAEGVKLGASAIPAARILSVVRGNGQNDRVVIVSGRGMVSGVNQMAAQTLSLLSRISHTVEVEHDGRRTTLAGGLTEAQANAVAAEVTRRLACF